LNEVAFADPHSKIVNKKWQATYIAPLQPHALAAFLPWGISRSWPYKACRCKDKGWKFPGKCFLGISDINFGLMNTSLSRDELQIAIQSWLPELSQEQLQAVYAMMHAFVKPVVEKTEAEAAAEADLAKQPNPDALRESMFSRLSSIVNPGTEPAGE